MSLVKSWSFEHKFEEVLKRALPKLGPAARAALAAIITPESLKTIAVVLSAWA